MEADGQGLLMVFPQGSTGRWPIMVFHNTTPTPASGRFSNPKRGQITKGVRVSTSREVHRTNGSIIFSFEYPFCVETRRKSAVFWFCSSLYKYMLGPPARCPFLTNLFGEGSRKIDYRKTLVPLFLALLHVPQQARS